LTAAAKPRRVTLRKYIGSPVSVAKTGWLGRLCAEASLCSRSRLLNKPGATVTVSFPKAGTYVFGTKAGEDYMKGVKTTGEDNVLTLKITVK
jgi:hypothetical protein